jgi:hypothetical protein
MSLLTNLVSYWKFDESSGNATDSVASRVLTNNNVTYVAGKINNGAAFDSGSSAEYLHIADNAVFKPASFTVAFWLKYQLNFGTNYLYQKNINKINITVGGEEKLSGHIHSADSGGLNGNITGNTTLTRGATYHVAMTFDGTDLRLFLNGVEDAGATSFAHAIDYDTSDVEIGKANDTYLATPQIIDELGLWSRALSFAELSSLYRDGNGYQYPFPTILTLGTGAFVLSGKDILIKRTLKLVASVGEFALSGVDIIFRKGKALVAQVGQFILTGNDIGWTDNRKWRTSGKKNMFSPSGQGKHSSTVTNISKNISSVSNVVKNTSIWVNKDKNSSVATNQSKS